jgi:hypothetical protein
LWWSSLAGGSPELVHRDLNRLLRLPPWSRSGECYVPVIRNQTGSLYST